MKHSTLTRLIRLWLLRLNPGRAGRISEVGSCVSLSDLEPGGCGCVIGCDLPLEKAARLLEMGFTNGTNLRVVRLSPFGDPMEVFIRGYHLSLRRAEAAFIRVEVRR